MKLKSLISKEKEQLSEGAISDMIASIFMAVNKNKIDATFKKIQKDPDIKNAIENYRKSVEDLRKTLQKNNLIKPD